MRAVLFRRHGGPEVLEEAEVPTPEVGASDVLVKVKGTALNHLDLWIRGGLPTLRLPLPHILGSDVVGVVEAVGASVDGVEVGAEVMVQPGISCMRCEACLSGRDNYCRRYQILGENVHGGYAEYVSVPHSNLLPKPENLSWEQAAAAPLAFLTAWEMLANRARLEAGETVLVQAAGSGVGSAGVQIAKLFGAQVIATASSADKLERARALGADHTIDYTEADVLEEVRRITDKRGVEVVFDHVGKSTWAGSVRALRDGGRLVTCGATTGYDVEVDLRHLFFRKLSLLGATMGSKGDLHRIATLLEQGKLRPVVDRVLPLSEARKAHELLADRAQFGKIVLVPQAHGDPSPGQEA